MKDDVEAGVLLVDKPAGFTSFDMIRSVRRVTGIKKVGHAGTLDPFATGLLVICIGRAATKLISQFMDGDKEYIATLRMGEVSSTQDPEGEITNRAWDEVYTAETIQGVFDTFRGEILQVPPSFSALKYKGKPLYHYARKGIEVIKEARKVHIHLLEWKDKREIVDNKNPAMTIRVVSSKGTYIRSLGSDIGETLGCGAYLTALRRTRSGHFSVNESIAGEELSAPDGLEKIRNRLLSVEVVQKYLQ